MIELASLGTRSGPQVFLSRREGVGLDTLGEELCEFFLLHGGHHHAGFAGLQSKQRLVKLFLEKGWLVKTYRPVGWSGNLVLLRQLQRVNHPQDFTGRDKKVCYNSDSSCRLGPALTQSFFQLWLGRGMKASVSCRGR